MSADTQVERELDAIDAALAGRPVDPDLTDLAALALALRDERMEADPFFVRDLDARAAAGFPREPRWRRLFTATPMLVPGVAASMLLALVVSVALMNPSGGRDEESAAGGAGQATEFSGGGQVESAPSGGAEDASALRDLESADEDAAVQKSASRPKPQGGSSAGASPAAVSPTASALSPTTGATSPKGDRRAARKVETSASLLLSTTPGKVQRVADDVVATTDRFAGFVVTSSVDVMKDGGGATFELRIPSGRLKQALADLSRLAAVRERREATQDITAQFVSARSRLADARADRTGLLRRLAKAPTDLERAAIKAELRRVSARIGAAKSALARVDNRASYSTIALSIAGDAAVGDDEDEGGTWTPGDAARDAVRVLEVAAGIALIVLALAVPLGVLAMLGVLGARLAARRRRERVLDAV